jgi:hypothetical protein
VWSLSPNKAAIMITVAVTIVATTNIGKAMQNEYIL